MGLSTQNTAEFEHLTLILDKKNIAALTCEQIREDLTYIPCRRPIVATDNDGVPDTTDLWLRHKSKPNKFGCPMTPGQACVKYTYTYNKGGGTKGAQIAEVVQTTPRAKVIHELQVAQVAHQVAKVVEVGQVTQGKFLRCYSHFCCLKNGKLENASYAAAGEFHISYVQNITYMCAKVNATVGCYHQKYISGLDVEVCVCESQLGAMPCNNTTKLTNKLSRVVLLTIAINTFITLYHKIFKYS
uniref:Uncharacterized protein n=2 Tax=Glossina TaxID=44049 RepID=A0A1A9VFF7_GLOAU